MEHALFQTLSDFQVRAEVESCISSMLQDVETAFHLQQQLELQSNQQQVESLTKQQKATILDADAERLTRDAEQVELADQLVVELMTLSQELEGLLEWKQKHQHKVDTFDELVAQLTQKEEELQAANRVSYGGDPRPRQPTAEPSKVDSSEKKVSPKEEEENEKEAVEKDVKSEPMIVLPEVDEAGVDSAAPDLTKDTKPSAEGYESTKQEATVVQIPASEAIDTPPGDEDSKPPPTEPTVAEIPTSPVGADIPAEPDVVKSKEEESPVAAAAAVMLDEEEIEDKVPDLVEIDVEILMNIFGFLDPMDILNTAQINGEMYTRVDNIFGISEDGHSAPQPTKTQSPPPQPPQLQPAAAAAKPAPKPQSEVTKPPPPAAATSGMGPLGKGLFSMLQPQPAAATAAAPGRGAKPAGKSQPFNASVAVSMAEKLSDSELAAIISITDKSSKLEKEVNTLRSEKEALAAKLDGTEAVKQFLIGKVRDVEQKLSSSKEEEIKVTQQIASDQEVIAFLDSQVQDLERSSDSVTAQRDGLKSELESLKVSSSKRITMLNDMLKYEREKLKDAEGEWKSTKKVLVKEVKSCRAQILALQAERDGYKEQNEMLKRAITSTGKNAATSPNR